MFLIWIRNVIYINFSDSYYKCLMLSIIDHHVLNMQMNENTFYIKRIHKRIIYSTLKKIIFSVHIKHLVLHAIT